MSTRPRIVLLVTLAETGGAQTYVSELVKGLGGEYDLTVGAYGPGPLREATVAAGADFVALRHVRRQVAPRDLLGLIELTLLLRRLRPQIVHASSSKAGILGRIAARLAGVPIRVFTVHGWAASAHTGMAAHIYGLAERAARLLTTATICVCESERDAGLAARACDARRTFVIHTGIDATSRPRARPGDGVPAIVSVGRFQAPKDAISLVRALALLRGEHRVALVGDGPDRASAMAEARRLGVDETVVFEGERDDVPDILASSHIFVLSSRSEALPVSILEAMAGGLPVVATRVGGVAELVVEGETGLLVNPGDTRALADALQRLVDDPDLRVRLGAAGRARVEDHFRMDSFLEAHRDLYSRALAESGRTLPSP
jgi:glycosyltransferase involved in cell wall biosynthesis